MMVAFVDCAGCRYGDHSRHHEIVQYVPPGVMGGMRCVCKGDCAERKARQDESRRQASVRPCPYCEGDGCSECDNTGQRVRTHIDAGDGVTFSVSGSAMLDPEAREALTALARAAYAQMGDQEPDRRREIMETQPQARKPTAPRNTTDDDACECRALYGPDRDGTFPARAMCPRAATCAAREREANGDA